MKYDFNYQIIFNYLESKIYISLDSSWKGEKFKSLDCFNAIVPMHSCYCQCINDSSNAKEYDTCIDNNICNDIW